MTGGCWRAFRLWKGKRMGDVLRVLRSWVMTHDAVPHVPIWGNVYGKASFWQTHPLSACDGPRTGFMPLTCGGGGGAMGTGLWSLFLLCEALTLGVTLCSVTVPEEKTFPTPQTVPSHSARWAASDEPEVILTWGWVQPEGRECAGPRPGPPRHLQQAPRPLMGRGLRPRSWLRVLVESQPACWGWKALGSLWV